MQQLLEKATIDYPELKRYILKIVTDSLSIVSEPCKYPETKKHYYELLRHCDLTETDVKDFTKRFWKGTKQSTWNLQNDPITMLYVALMNYSLVHQNDNQTYSIICAFLGIRYYTNLMSINIKYCNPEYFKYALNAVFKTHLFTREGSIAAAIMHLSKELQTRFTPRIIKMEPDGVAAFITEYRTRMAQSVKKFAAVYYDAAKHGMKVKNPYEDDESQIYQDLDKTNHVSAEVAKKICVYKTKDMKALESSKKLTKINSKLAATMVDEVHNTIYIDQVRIAFDLFLKDVKNIKNICDKDYYGYLRSLISSKKQTDSLTLRKHISDLTVLIMQNLKFDSKFQSFTAQTKLSVYLFLAYYLTGVLRNTICYQMYANYKG